MTDHILDPDNIASAMLADGERDDWRTRGFWRESSNIPGEPRLIVGNPDKFARDLAGMRARYARRLDKMVKQRFILIPDIQWFGFEGNNGDLSK